MFGRFKCGLEPSFDVVLIWGQVVSWVGRPGLGHGWGDSLSRAMIQ
jgi:hypothetical protein